MLRRRLEALEKRQCKPGACPTCGLGDGDGAVTLIDVWMGEGPPLGYWYEKPWPDHRPGERFAYPPDPRPACPACGKRIGPILILTAVYDADEWHALRGKNSES